jgi:hypothetical protein
MQPQLFSSSLVLFIYLQLLDVLTTLVGFSLGASEASPFISALIRWGPLAGILASKLFAIAILGACLWHRRLTLLRLVNVWYAALTAWNLCIVLRLLTARA